MREDGTTIILVEQNAAAAFKVADRALVIERGQVVIRGKPSELVNNERVQHAYLDGPGTGTTKKPLLSEPGMLAIFSRNHKTGKNNRSKNERTGRFSLEQRKV